MTATHQSIEIDENIDPMDDSIATYCADCGAYPLPQDAAHVCLRD